MEIKSSHWKRIYRDGVGAHIPPKGAQSVETSLFALVT